MALGGSGVATINGIEIGYQVTWCGGTAGPPARGFRSVERFGPNVGLLAVLGGGHRDAGWDRAEMTRHRLAILPG